MKVDPHDDDDDAGELPPVVGARYRETLREIARAANESNEVTR